MREIPRPVQNAATQHVRGALYRTGQLERIGDMKMKRVGIVAAVLAIGMLISAQANAALLVNLSSPDDLTNLTVGQTVTIDVSITGVPASGLAALVVEFLGPPSIFSTPVDSDLTTGSIVPDASDFLPQVLAANPPTEPNFVASGLYLQGFGGGAIVSDGVFYSVKLKVAGEGTGQLEIDTRTLLAADEALAPTDIGIDNGSLRVRVPGTENPIPEPASLSMAALAAVGLLGRRSRRTA